MKVFCYSKEKFIKYVLPNLNEDCFYISILDSDEPDSLMPNSENYRTWWFYDLEEDINNYKAISDQQAQEIYEFIKANDDKSVLYVHCAAGVSRSAAVGEFAFEYYGGAWKDFLKDNPNILPNGRVLRMLRCAEALDKKELNINFS